MFRNRWLCFLLTLLAMAFAASTAHADSIQITLTQTSQSGVAGTIVTFDATLTNLTTTALFLNGDTSSTVSTLLTVDDTPFLTNAPLSLAAGASSGPFPFFSVLIGPGTPAGTYSPNTFSILGGVSSSGFTTLGTADFTVDVLSSVPEPGTLTFLVTGVLGLGIWKQWIRR